MPLRISSYVRQKRRPSPRGWPTKNLFLTTKLRRRIGKWQTRSSSPTVTTSQKREKGEEEERDGEKKWSSSFRFRSDFPPISFRVPLEFVPGSPRVRSGFVPGSFRIRAEFLPSSFLVRSQFALSSVSESSRLFVALTFNAPSILKSPRSATKTTKS